MKLTEHFNSEEFACKCCGVSHMNTEFMGKLENLRQEVGVPFIITSGYRCPAHNQKVGGAVTSAHLYGQAADIKLAGSDAARLVARAASLGITGLGLKQHGDYDARYVHVDTRHDTFTVWTYK